MDAAGTDQIRLAPRSVESGNVCGESDDGGRDIGESVEMDGGIEENFAGFDFVSLRYLYDGQAQLGRIGDEAEHDFGASVVGNDVGGAATADGADVESGLAKNGVERQRQRADLGENVEKRMDGGVTEFGISRMGEFAASEDFVAENAFGAESELIFSGFAVDEKTRAARRGRGSDGAGAIAFLANDKKKSEVAGALGEQSFGGMNHGGDDAFGVATAAAVDVGVVLEGREIWRDGIHVGGKSDDGIAEGEEEIVAVGRSGDALEAAVVAMGQRGEMRKKKIANRLFVSGGGIEIDERTSQSKKVHSDPPG